MKKIDLSTQEGILAALEEAREELQREEPSVRRDRALRSLAKVALQLQTPAKPTKLEQTVKKLRALVEKETTRRSQP